MKVGVGNTGTRHLFLNDLGAFEFFERPLFELITICFECEVLVPVDLRSFAPNTYPVARWTRVLGG